LNKKLRHTRTPAPRRRRSRAIHSGSYRYSVYMHIIIYIIQITGMRGPTRLSLYIGTGNIICDVCTPSHSVYARLHSVGIYVIICIYYYYIGTCICICTRAFITIIIITPIIVVAYVGTYIARLIRIWYIIYIYAASACKCKYYTMCTPSPSRSPSQ